MIKIGITGGIGSGKSVVSELLRLLDVPVYDTDSNAKRLQTEDAEIRQKFIETLGEECYLCNGQLNKPFIANKIFNDRSLLEAVNSIVHPVVKKDFENWAKIEQQKGNNIVGIESAILFEAKLNKEVDYVWVVDAPIDIRIERAILRDKNKREQIEARIRNQQTTYKDADATIVNDDKHSLIDQVCQLLEKIQ